MKANKNVFRQSVLLTSLTLATFFALGLSRANAAPVPQLVCSWGGNIKAVGSKAIPIHSFKYVNCPQNQTNLTNCGRNFVPLLHTGNWTFSVYYDPADGIQITKYDTTTNVTENTAAGPRSHFTYFQLNSHGYQLDIICQLKLNGQGI